MLPAAIRWLVKSSDLASLTIAMPARGRDSHYLEYMIASGSLAMAAMCMFYLDRVSTLYMPLMYAARIDIPVWVWAAMWTLSAAALGVGAFRNDHVTCEWAALYTASLWIIIFYAAWSNRLLFPMSLAMSPCFIVFSARIYHYRKRYGRPKYVNARTTDQ
jgi:hypothetical protein